MSSKHKKRPEYVARPATVTPRAEVERLIAKEHLKDAVKQAKICYRDEPTPEHHQLLERAYFLRASQLLADAMPSSAKEVAYHLLDFGVTDDSLIEQVSRLLISVGLPSQAKEFQSRIESPEVLERLAIEEADLAVVHPNRMSGASESIRQGGQTIRGAIEAIQNGDDAKGSEFLREISRNSPFADWKLFARGLAAHNRGDESESKANWDRVDPNRAAARIVSALRKLAEPSRPLPSGEEKRNARLDALERRIFGASVLEPLEQLRLSLANKDWSNLNRQIGPVRQLLSRIDPFLAERLTRTLYSPLIRESHKRDFDSATTLVKQFTRAAQPLSMDPRWNRLWALIWQGDQGDLEEAEKFWRSYAADLETLPHLSQDERTLARALVFKHLGDEHVREVDAYTDSPSLKLPRERVSHELETEQNRAVACFEASLKLAPNHAPTYHGLIKAYQDWNRHDEAVPIARRLLESFPNDYEALMFLSDDHLRKQEPEPALEYARRARALKPLDRLTINHEWRIHILHARVLALKGRWDEGRAAFETADSLEPENATMVLGRARKAVFELKARETERSSEIIADALEKLPDVTAFWLATLIEGIRYKLPKTERDRFEAHFTAGLSKKVSGTTAGALADVLFSYLISEIEYTGRAGQIRDVVDYLKRATKIKYKHDDIVNVCVFLSRLEKQTTLLGQFIQRGLKSFPTSPVLLLCAAKFELKKGPTGGGRIHLAEQYLERALDIIEKSGDPSHAYLLPEIREKLSTINEFSSLGLPFMFGGFGGNPYAGAGMGGFASAFRAMLDGSFDLMDDPYESWDDDGEEEGEEAFHDLSTPPSSPTASGPTPKKPKASSKAKKKKG